MAAGIKAFNYSWKDMTCPPVSMMMDIVRIALNEINNGGKVAVHCHAGFGRTGIVIASIMMAQHGYDAEYTINMIREKRPGSVQTTQQQVFVYEFKAAYSKMEEFYPTCNSGSDGPYCEKGQPSGLKSIKTSEKDQFYCLVPDEAMKYAKCAKPVALAIALLKTSSVLSAALTSCFIIGLHPSFVVKGDAFNPLNPLFMPPLISSPTDPTNFHVLTNSCSSNSNDTAPPVHGLAATSSSRGIHVSQSVDTGLAELEDTTVTTAPPRSQKRPQLFKNLQNSLAYSVAQAQYDISTVDWISEELLEAFKSEANRGIWTRWSPPKTNLAKSSPTEAAKVNKGIGKLSESIEIIHKTPRLDVGTPGRPVETLPKVLISLNDDDPGNLSPESSVAEKTLTPVSVGRHKQPASASSLPPLNFSPIAKGSAPVRRRSKENVPYLPTISAPSPIKPADSNSTLPLLSARPVDMLGIGKSKSFSTMNDLNSDSDAHVHSQCKVGDDHVSEAIVQEELAAREKLISLKNSVKRKTSKVELLCDDEDGSHIESSRKRKSISNLSSCHSEQNLNISASGYLEMVQALSEANTNGENLEHEAPFFLGGILLVDWLESRSDPLLDDKVLEMLSDAWCKSMSTKGSSDSNEHSRKVGSEGALFMSTPCEPVTETGTIDDPPQIEKLVTQGKSVSFLGGLVESLSPERPKASKRSGKGKNIPPRLGRGSTYASFGVEGEPVTGKMLDDLLKTHMPK